MSLTGTPFQMLIIACAVLVTVGAVVLWNRVRGPRVVRVFSRIGLLLAGYAVSAVAVLVSINIAYGGLIATWGDLFDNMSAHGAGRPGGGNFAHSRNMCGGKPPGPGAGGAFRGDGHPGGGRPGGPGNGGPGGPGNGGSGGGHAFRGQRPFACPSTSASPSPSASGTPSPSASGTPSPSASGIPSPSASGTPSPHGTS